MPEINLAPIVLFVYNRPWHTRRTLDALMVNELADRSKLIIYSDGPEANDTEEQISRINEVRRLIREKQWCGQVEIIESGINKGLAGSIVSGVTEVINVHGQVIVIEDDLVTSQYFLKYMNDGLNYYKDENNVISLHAYIPALKGVLPETFFLRGADCWGWASWKRGWELFNMDGIALYEELKKRRLTKKFDLDGTIPFTSMLKAQIEGQNDSWAIRWYASAFLEDKLTLYPGRSLVHNIGNDSTGVHCSTSDIYDVVISERPIHVGDIAIENAYGPRELFKAWARTAFPPITKWYNPLALPGKLIRKLKRFSLR